MRVAIYGKGGIGKSTTSSNLSYSLSKRGIRVMQIGCDPKHDSTMPLTGGVKQQTVLDYVRRVPPSERKLSDVAITGANGVVCIEAGGPEPGIGCAGRGILTTFNTLRDLGIDDIDTDYTVYDVLGDVVCGGFAVPMRTENSDAVFVVTSGEFMSMYAANNILRGLLNFDPENPRVAGIILNERGMDNEYERVKVFADAVQVPIVLTMPRSKEFKDAEKEGLTVSELYPDSEPARIFGQLADLVMDLESGRAPLYRPSPLTDEQLNDLMAGRKLDIGLFNYRKKCVKPAYLGMGSCASRGAVYEAGRIVDMPIIIHGPRSCGYVMAHTQDGHYLADVYGSPTAQAKMRNNIACTDMKDKSSIFGGKADLNRELQRMWDAGKRTVVVVTTCVSGMIGDDMVKIASEFEESHPGMQIINIPADGNLTGESEEGRILVLEAYCDLIDQSVEPTEDALNLVDDTFMWFGRGRNELFVRRILGRLGIRLGCKLFEDSTIEQVRNCRKNKFCMVVDDSSTNRKFRKMLEARGLRFVDTAVPQGIRETVKWVRCLAEAYGKDPEPIVSEMEAEYRAALDRVRPYLEGKVVDFSITMYSSSDWMIDAMIDAGADVRRVYGVRYGPGSDSFHTDYVGKLDMRLEQDFNQTMQAIRDDQPEILIGSMMRKMDLDCTVIGGIGDTATHYGQIAWLDYICNMMRAPKEEGWLRWGDSE